MADASYKIPQEQIRTPAPTRVIAAMPSIGSFLVGSLALPGPQIPMSFMETAPAFRSPAAVVGVAATQVADVIQEQQKKRKREAARLRRGNAGTLVSISRLIIPTYFYF